MKLKRTPAQGMPAKETLAMPLAVQALTPIVIPVQGVAVTCHQAVWYWAALEADAQGLTAARPILTRMGNIAAIPNGAQAAMLALPRAGMLNFAQNGNALPAFGTVLLWLTGATHVAIVTAHGITGYNQACVFPHLPNLGNYSSCQPIQLANNQRTCYMITENNVVMTAGGVFHL
jgi:hypothetical protein